MTSQILAQLIVILILTQIFSYFCRKIGQQPVIGEILLGIALGPTLLGALLPGIEGALFPLRSLPTLQTLGDIGLILSMFSLGAEIDTHLMLSQSRKAVIISVAGVVLPLIAGGGLAYYLFPVLAGPKANLLSFILLIGTAIAITAFPVLARLLAEKNMLGTRIGTLALTCAAIDDVLAWGLLALVVAIIHAQGVVISMVTLSMIVLFLGAMFFVVRPVLIFAERRIESRALVLALSMILLLLAAYFSNVVNIHPAFGAFLMGIILPRKKLFIEQSQRIHQTNGQLFLPLYFIYSGLRTQIGLIRSPSLWLICLLVIGVACAGKILGCVIFARFLKEPWKESIGLGVLMNTRGLIELIVLNIGLDLGILSPTLFSMFVVMAVVTTMMASPLLSLLGYRDRKVGEGPTLQEADDVAPKEALQG